MKINAQALTWLDNNRHLQGEAVGLWYQRAWARWFVLILVAIGILPEIFELIKGFSLLKLLVFLANLGVFIYLLQNFPKRR